MDDIPKCPKCGSEPCVQDDFHVGLNIWCPNCDDMVASSLDEWDDLCEEAKKKQKHEHGKLYRVWVSKTSHKVVVVKARSKKEAEKAAKKSVEQNGLLGDELCFNHPHDTVDSIESALPTDTPDYIAVKSEYGPGHELIPAE